MRSGMFFFLVLIALCVGLLISGCWFTSHEDGQNIGADLGVFSHKVHRDLEVECVMCHENIPEATVSSQRNLPNLSVCETCHEVSALHLPERLLSAPDAMQAAWYVKTDIVFSHKTHLDRVKNDCQVCHERIAASEQIKDRNLPPMETCLSCHKQTFIEGNCTQCHSDLSGLGLKPIAAFSHEGDFLKTHGNFVKSSAATCVTCHDERYCSDCHAQTTQVTPALRYPDAVTKTLIHRGDYVTRHPIDADAEPHLCLKCHATSFCSTCHERQNVAFASNPQRQIHPIGFSDPSSPYFHGPQAKRNITACAACHDQGEQSNCVPCHRVGGIAGNPHPPNWNPRLDPLNNRMCLTCH